MSVHNHSRGVTNLDQVEKILTDYQESGSIKVVKDSKTLHLIPWFLISKPDLGGGVKWRLIADCRELNQHFIPSPFKLDHLQQIFPNLRKGDWGATPRAPHLGLVRSCTLLAGDCNCFCLVRSGPLVLHSCRSWLTRCFGSGGLIFACSPNFPGCQLIYFFSWEGGWAH